MRLTGVATMSEGLPVYLTEVVYFLMNAVTVSGANSDAAKVFEGALLVAIERYAQEREAEISNPWHKQQAWLALHKRIAALESQLAMANDAAAKGDRARHDAGGMEMRIKELEAQLADIRKQAEDSTEYVLAQINQDLRSQLAAAQASAILDMKAANVALAEANARDERSLAQAIELGSSANPFALPDVAPMPVQKNVCPHCGKPL